MSIPMGARHGFYSSDLTQFIDIIWWKIDFSSFIGTNENNPR
jgi:hypothetical protein